MLAIASIFFMSIFMRLFQKVLFSCEKPKSIKIIGKSAFDGCKVLKAVVLPDSIKNIKSYAFCGCSRLKLAYLGSGITDIASDAFPSTEGLAFYNGTASDWGNIVNDGLDWSNLYTGEQPKGAFIAPNTKIKKGLFIAGSKDSVACLGTSYIVEDYENVEKYTFTLYLYDTNGDLKYQKVYELASSDSSPNIMLDLGLTPSALNGYTATVTQIQIQYKDGASEYTITDYSATISTGTAFSSGTPVAPISSTMYTK